MIGRGHHDCDNDGNKEQGTIDDAQDSAAWAVAKTRREAPEAGKQVLAGGDHRGQNAVEGKGDVAE